MNKMSRLEKKLATVILTVVGVGFIALLLHFFVYKPNREEIKRLESQIAELSDKVEEAKKAPALIVSYKEKISELIGGSKENSNLLNKSLDVPDILRVIENASAGSGIQFEEISFNGNASFVKGGFIEKEDGTTEKIVNTENFYLLEIKLKSIADYKQLWSFLKSCEDSGFYVTVDHIDIADEKSGGLRLEGEVQVNFYSVVSIEMAENAKK